MPCLPGRFEIILEGTAPTTVTSSQINILPLSSLAAKPCVLIKGVTSFFQAPVFEIPSFKYLPGSILTTALVVALQIVVATERSVDDYPYLALYIENSSAAYEQNVPEHFLCPLFPIDTHLRTPAINNPGSAMVHKVYFLTSGALFIHLAEHSR
jgi:hypothetical protein